MSHNPRVSLFATLTHDESIDTPLSITNNNGTFYYHRDHQGSIVALTDENGNVVESFAYDNHYGAIINRTKTVETNNPYAYTGREFDAKELYYYRARYYDPQIQRFLSEDPIGFSSGDTNFYRYVWDSSVNYIDPYGKISFRVALRIALEVAKALQKAGLYVELKFAKPNHYWYKYIEDNCGNLVRRKCWMSHIELHVYLKIGRKKKYLYHKQFEYGKCYKLKYGKGGTWD